MTHDHARVHATGGNRQVIEICGFRLPPSFNAAMASAAWQTLLMNSASFPQKVSPLAVASVILSMGLLSIGNGLMFSYIPIQLSAAGF